MIPLVSPLFGTEEKEAVTAVIDSRMLASGAVVTQFEQSCAAAFNARHAIAVSNGTTALHAALLAAGITAGDTVLTTPFSFIATANSILHCSARPLFADIDPKTYNLSPELAERELKRNRKIKALLVVHLYGMPADMDAFLALKKKYRVALIEDCAQAHAAQYNGTTVGTFGDAAAFSCYATKNMTTGEGGIVLTGSSSIDRRVRQIINHGRAGHSTHTLLGYNYRLTNLAAAIGLVQLRHLPAWTAARQQNAAALSSRLNAIDGVTVPAVPAGCTPVYHQYTIRVPASRRTALMKHLQARGISSGIYYPTAIYRQPLYRHLGYRAGICPEAEKAAREVLSLPVHPSLTAADLAEIADGVRSFFTRG